MVNYNPDFLKDAHSKHKATQSLLQKCFEDVQYESKLNIREYIAQHQFVIFKGQRIDTNYSMSYMQVESELIPIKYLQEAIDIEEGISNAKAWLRIWNGICNDYCDFIIGLPGECNEFDDEFKQLTWEEVKQGEAFDDMESRLFARQLLT